MRQLSASRLRTDEWSSLDGTTRTARWSIIRALSKKEEDEEPVLELEMTQISGEDADLMDLDVDDELLAPHELPPVTQTRNDATTRNVNNLKRTRSDSTGADVRLSPHYDPAQLIDDAH